MLGRASRGEHAGAQSVAVQLGAILLVVVSAGCTESGGASTCATNAECPAGQYCGSANRCTFECRTSADCPGRTCTSLGRCIGSSPSDVGGTLPDSATKDAALRDARRPDRSLPDTAPSIDRPLASDASPDLSPTSDLPLPDLRLPADALAGGVTKMGHGCKPSKGGLKHPDCSSGASTCVILSSARDLGFCSRNCTPDNRATPLINEDDCPIGFQCGVFTFGASRVNYCLKECTPSTTANPCHATSKQSCHPASVRFTSSLGQAACWYLACENAKDCPVRAAKTCTKDSDCVTVGTGAFCDLTGGVCALPGNCTKGGICGPHTQKIKSGAKVGDPCKSDLDCPAAGSCIEEGVSGSSSAIGVPYRNGYCVISGCRFASAVSSYACGTGAECHQLFYGGLCHRSCDPSKAATCRGNASDKGGDYECYDWSGLVIGGVGVTSGAVCQMSARQRCNGGVPQTPSDPCAQLAAVGNPQKMTCRDRSTGKLKSNKKDPSGICLDSTASGSF